MRKINFKIDHSESTKLWVEERINRLEKYLETFLEGEIAKAKKEESRIREMLEKEISFWESNTKEVFSSRSGEGESGPWHETKGVYKDTGKISSSTFEPMKAWCCKFCGREVCKKYIVTGHDHTDYSYDICNCEGARLSGKNSKDLD